MQQSISLQSLCRTGCWLALAACASSTPLPDDTDAAQTDTDTVAPTGGGGGGGTTPVTDVELAEGAWIFRNTVTEDGCGGFGLFEQEIRGFLDEYGLVNLRAGDGAPCTTAGQAVDCEGEIGPLTTFPDVIESGALAATSDGTTLTGTLTRTLDCTAGCPVGVAFPCDQTLDVDAAAFAPGPSLSPTSCDEEGTLASGLDLEQTRFDVQNDTGETLWIAWLDYAGNRTAGEEIAAGDTWSAYLTFVGHPFVIYDGSDACVAIAEPTADWGVLVLDP